MLCLYEAPSIFRGAEKNSHVIPISDEAIFSGRPGLLEQAMPEARRILNANGGIPNSERLNPAMRRHSEDLDHKKNEAFRPLVMAFNQLVRTLDPAEIATTRREAEAEVIGPRRK